MLSTVKIKSCKSQSQLLSAVRIRLESDSHQLPGSYSLQKIRFSKSCFDSFRPGSCKHCVELSYLLSSLETLSIYKAQAMKCLRQIPDVCNYDSETSLTTLSRLRL